MTPRWCPGDRAASPRGLFRSAVRRGTLGAQQKLCVFGPRPGGCSCSNAEASRFGASNRIPLLTRVLPAGRERTPTVSASALRGDPPELLLISARPASRGDGVMLLLREVDSERIEATLTFSGAGQTGQLRRSNVLEDDLGPVAPVVVFPPFRHEFLRWGPGAMK